MTRKGTGFTKKAERRFVHKMGQEMAKAVPRSPEEGRNKIAKVLAEWEAKEIEEMAKAVPEPIKRAKVGAASRPSSAETVANPKDPRFRSRAGKKPDYNWEAAITEAGRYMFENGVPTKLEELLEHVAKWFGESEPSHSQLTQKIGPVYRAFKSVSSG